MIGAVELRSHVNSLASTVRAGVVQVASSPLSLDFVVTVKVNERLPPLMLMFFCRSTAGMWNLPSAGQSFSSVLNVLVASEKVGPEISLQFGVVVEMSVIIHVDRADAPPQCLIDGDV